MVILRKITLLLAASMFACADTVPDPKELPLIFEVEAEYPRFVFPSDLDGDGKDELIQIQPSQYLHGSSRLLGFLWITTLEGNIVEQVNYPGIILGYLGFLDWDHDGRKEILVPYTINDSLFVSFVSAKGEKLFSFFLIDGQPRREDNAVIPWDPYITHFYLQDVDGDQREELITVMVTGYARLPRGVLIHSLPEGKLLGKVIVGAHLNAGIFDDFDGDGKEEFLAGTNATNNNAEAGNFDDRHTYLINFKLSPQPHVAWSRQLGNLWHTTRLSYQDFDRNGTKEILVFTSGSDNQILKSQFEFISPGSWQVYQQRLFNEPLQTVATVDLNLDLKPEIIALRPPNEVVVLNNKFEITKRRIFPYQLKGLWVKEDFDDDNVDEILALTGTDGLFLNPDLEIKAVLAHPGDVDNVVKSGVGKKPYFITGGVSGKDNFGQVNTRLLRLKENRFYLWYRYGPTTLWALGFCLTSALVVVVVASLRRYRLQKIAQTFIIDTDARGLLFLNEDGKIVMANATFRQWTNIDRRGISFKEVIAAPELVVFLQQAILPPVRHHETILSINSCNEQRPVQVMVEPVPIAGKNKPYWLVSVVDRSAELDKQQIQIWSNMAKRIAHDLKNPLTAIQLTLQRLQMEYHEQATSEISRKYDGYTNRIMERIDALRLMTSNFVKFMNLEKILPVETDLDSFLRSTAEAISKNLPPDVAFDVKLNADSVRVSIDQYQIKVLLDNLITNAINAMPEGGKITLATRFEKNLQLRSHAQEPRDYAIIEISDTGRGMPATIVDKIFEPGFTASEHGTGLGLAIVKKIVEGHRGYIEVESAEGVGTMFGIYLPA